MGATWCCQKSCTDGDVSGSQLGALVHSREIGDSVILGGDEYENEDVNASGTRRGSRKSKDKRIGRQYSSMGSRLDDNDGSVLLKFKRTRDKGKETRKLIRAAIKQDRVCALFEESEIETILEAMEYFVFRKNDFVCQQGQSGSTFFVTHSGTLEVLVNDKVCNTMRRGNAFGGLALMYNCPRTASVKALEEVGVWGASGTTFHKVLQENSQKRLAENRKFIDSIRMFDGLTDKQKDRNGAAFFTEVFEDKSRVFTEGEASTAIHFVKKGTLLQFVGGKVDNSGEYSGGTLLSELGPGDCIGERALLDGKQHSSTVVSSGRSELVCISVGALKEALGEDWGPTLERSFILQRVKWSSVISQFSSTQQYAIVKAMTIKTLKPQEVVEEQSLRFAVVLDGSVCGTSNGASVTLERGQWYEEADANKTDGGKVTPTNSEAEKNKGVEDGKTDMVGVKAGEKGTRLGILTEEHLAKALQALGLSSIGNAAQAVDYTRKMVMAKKVHIFRHLSEEQTNKLVRCFTTQTMKKGDIVFKQSDLGSSFYVIAAGEVKVFINEKMVRNMGKNSYFGERALLFDEPRTATIEVASATAELWSIDKNTFSQIVKGKMQQELMHRIRLQDTSFTLKQLQPIKVIGAGAAGVVRLVEHKATKMRYALKRVNKHNGKIPEEVKRECNLLKDCDHPFIMTMVKNFEVKDRVYILTELITGGELHGAIRMFSTVLSRAQAQFYAGSLVIVLEELCDRSIVYRDLKPENVMLDAQGYLKLIDFGIAKKLEEGKNRTFTMIGTPHYMAPEVMRGHGYGTEVDLWSLGIILYEFVCGCLPFADELDDPTEVCTAVLRHNLTFPGRYKDLAGRTVIQGLLCRQPKKRLGAGIHGYEDVKSEHFFKAGHEGTSLFNKIMGRELDPPVLPKGEVYCATEDLPGNLSDDAEIG